MTESKSKYGNSAYLTTFERRIIAAILAVAGTISGHLPKDGVLYLGAFSNR